VPQRRFAATAMLETSAASTRAAAKLQQ